MVYEPLSIVVPVRDREHLITRCLDSVRHQSYRPIRLIVVDNDSKDNTLAVVRKWKAEHESEDFSVKVVSEPRHGAAAARNRGLLEVDTERMMFFDSDDRMLPELAVTVMETFDRHPKLDLVYWRYAVVNSRDEVIPRRFARVGLIKRHLYNGVFCTVAYAIRTSFIKRIGAWNSSIRCWDDWELGLRILTENPNMKGIYRTLVHIYPQENSITGTSFSEKAGEWEKAIYAMEKHAKTLSEPLRTNVLDMLLYRRIILAATYDQEGRPDLAQPLRTQTMEMASRLSGFKQKLLNWIYAYRRRGGRAAYLLWK